MKRLLGYTLVNNSDLKNILDITDSDAVIAYLKTEKYKGFVNKVKKALYSNSDLTNAEVVEVVTNQKLIRNFRFFLKIADKNKLKLRKKYKLDSYIAMRDHILYEDPSGRTKGCECWLCTVRNKEYKSQLWLNSYIIEKRRLGFINNAVDKISSNLIAQYGSDFDITSFTKDIKPFDVEIFNNFGNVYKRKFKIMKVGTAERKFVSNIRTSFKKQKEPLEFYSVDAPSKIIDRITRVSNNIDEKQVKRERELKKITNFRKLLQSMF